MLADIEYPTYELIEIAKFAREHIHSIGGALFWIAIPLALLPPIPIRWRWIWIRTAVITLVVWIVLMDFRITYEVPWNRIVLDIEKRDSGYDGVGGNAALLLVGWTFPFIQCLVTLCVTRFILIRIGRCRKASTEHGVSQLAEVTESGAESEDKTKPKSEVRPQ